MKYIVKTGSAVNEMMLHSTNKPEFETSDLDETLNVFEAEVKELERCYDKASQLDYKPSEQEWNHAIYCSLISKDEDDEIEFLKDSEYFFER